MLPRAAGSPQSFRAGTASVVLSTLWMTEGARIKPGSLQACPRLSKLSLLLVSGASLPSADLHRLRPFTHALI